MTSESLRKESGTEIGLGKEIDEWIMKRPETTQDEKKNPFFSTLNNPVKSLIYGICGYLR